MTQPPHETADAVTGAGGPVVPAAGPADARRVRADTPVVRVACYVALTVVGALLALWGAFLVPLRIGGVEGLSVVIAVVGNLAVGVLGAVGTGTRLGAVLPGVGWVVVALAMGSSRPEGDLVIPGRLSTDPGVGTVGTLFLMLGAVAAAVAVGIGPASARRFTERRAVPRQQA